MARARTFLPPPWWVSAVKAHVKIGQGKAPLGPGVITQQGLGELIAEEYGEEARPSASDISLCVTGKRVPIEMAEQVSRVLKISAPIFVARSSEEAGRLQAQRDITERLERSEGKNAQQVAEAEEVFDREIDELDEYATGVESIRESSHRPVLPKSSAAKKRGGSGSGVREGSRKTGAS